MSEFVKRGACIPICGYEEDYLEFKDMGLSICEAVHRASDIKYPPQSVIHAFDVADSEYYQKKVDDYRQDTGRKWPPVFNIEIRVNVEPLSDSETEAYWLHRQGELASS